MDGNRYPGDRILIRAVDRKSEDSNLLYLPPYWQRTSWVALDMTITGIRNYRGRETWQSEQRLYKCAHGVVCKQYGDGDILYRYVPANRYLPFYFMTDPGTGIWYYRNVGIPLQFERITVEELELEETFSVGRLPYRFS